MHINLSDIFMVEPIQAGTINGWIQLPTSFVIMLYCAIIITATVSVIFFVLKKDPFAKALRKSIIIAFFCSGFLYLINSEKTWYTWLSQDIVTYSGHSVEEKIRLCMGPLYDYAKVAQNVLKERDYSIYSSYGPSSLIAQYYLLPMRKRVNAKDIIVLYDNDTNYDERTNTFSMGDEHIENAELLYRYDSGAYILRIK